MATERRDVELVIRGKDLTSAPFKEVEAAIDAVNGRLRENASAASKQQKSFAELSEEAKQLKQAGEALANQQGLIDSYTRLTAALARAGTEAQNLKTRQAELAAIDPSTMSKRQAAELARVERGLKNNATATEKQRAQLTEVTAALGAAGHSTDDLAGASARLVARGREVGAGLTALSTVMAAYSRNAAEAAQAQELLNFRAQGDAALRAAQGFRTFAEAKAAATTANTSTQDALAAATPGVAGINSVARRSLSGLEGVSSAALANVRAMEAAGKPIENFVESLQDMERTIKRANDVAKQVDGYTTQKAALVEAERAYAAAEAKLKALAASTSTAAKPSKELAEQLTLAQRATFAAGQAMEEQRAKTTAAGAALRAQGVEVDRLADEQKRLQKVVQDTTQGITRLQAAAKKQGVREGDNFGILGLRPYELQNLSFQVNDFFTQISSGTSVTQAFAQQIGQVIQIGRVGDFLKSQIPLIAAFGTALALAAAAIQRTLGQMQLLRQASAQRAFGGGFAPEEVLKAANAAQRLGLSFTDAREAALALARVPLNTQQYQQLTQAVANYAIATGDAKRATEQFQTAFSGGTAAILELDNQYGRLSRSQREFIEQARSQEDISRAVSIALGVYSAAASSARQQATTPLTESLINLRSSWNSLLDSLASPGAISTATTAINGLRGSIDGLAVALRTVAPLLPTLGSLAETAADYLPGIGAARRLARAAPGIVNAVQDVTADRRTFTGDRGGQGGAVPGVRDPEQQTQDATADQVATQERLARVGRQRVAEMEEEVRLEREIRKGTAEHASQAERLASIESARRKAQLDFRRANQNADDDSVRRFGQIAADRQRELVDEKLAAERDKNAREGRAALRRELSDIESDIRSVEQVRNDVIQQTQEDIRAGALSALDGMARIQRAAEEAKPRLAALADEAKRFVDANRGRDGLRDARGDALVSRATRAADSNRATNNAGRQVLQGQQQALQQAVQERSAFIQTINALEQQGAITTGDAQERVRVAYASTNESITQQINALEALAQSQLAAGQITQTQFQSIAASIELARAQLVYIDPALAQLRQAFEQTFVQSIGAGIDHIAEAIGNVVAGMGTWADVTRAAGRAILNVFADVLRAIGQTIIKQQLLNAVQAASGFLGLAGGAAGGVAKVAHAGGVIGSPGGRMRRVDPAWFAGAPRFHGGGVIGIAPDEQAIIAQRGEEMLTKDDPRNILNMAKNRGGSGEGDGVGIRNVLVMDPNELSNALSGAAGERVITSYIKRNAATLRQVLR